MFDVHSCDVHIFISSHDRSSTLCSAYTHVHRSTICCLVGRIVPFGVPSLALAVLGGGGDGVVASCLAFLVRRAVEDKKNEEEKAKVKKLKEEMEAAEHEEKMQELNRRVQADLPLSAAERSTWRQWIVAYAASSSSSAGKTRKRKKRRKRRLPRTSSHSSCGRARRRQRQWLGCIAGFPGDVTPRAVFPSSVGMSEFPGILAGMDHKDSGALIVGSCSYMCKARIAGFTARCVFPLVVGRPAGRLV